MSVDKPWSVRLENVSQIVEFARLCCLPKSCISSRCDTESIRIASQIDQDGFECAQYIANLSAINIVDENEMSHVGQSSMQVPNRTSDDYDQEHRDKCICVDGHGDCWFLGCGIGLSRFLSTGC